MIMYNGLVDDVAIAGFDTQFIFVALNICKQFVLEHLLEEYSFVGVYYI